GSCAYPLCFPLTDLRNPPIPELCPASVRKNHLEKCDQIANDGTARRLHALFGRSLRRTGSSFQVTLIFPLSVLGEANLEMVLCCAMNKQGAAVSKPPWYPWS